MLLNWFASKSATYPVVSPTYSASSVISASRRPESLTCLSGREPSQRSEVGRRQENTGRECITGDPSLDASSTA
ncbi:unnamed protein product [Protopolystoma xenopodis]|uniref:Uncharacterized protein n=1 Tax=Protopolystoma xenopodis TaxID=117903 RepID=A0A448XL25_9PLAT|nr:unnamed protein product [Protopolystoma xenopodis]